MGIPEMIIRNARLEDAVSFVRIKEQLPMPEGNESTSGGFLLGTDIETYGFYIRKASVKVIDSRGVKGFSIIMPDTLVRQSELWQKKEQVETDLNLAGFDNVPICYYEQLAVLPAYREKSSLLAYRSASEAFRKHDLMFMTTVRFPLKNKAAHSLMKAAGAVHIGIIEEHYPDAGDIFSDVFMLKKEDFIRNTAEFASSLE